jgi:CheY-like chemotaxis protein
MPGELPNLRGPPVLVVDDNATDRRILWEILRNWRMKPIVAESGRGALAAFRKARKPIPLVLVDAQMPEIDGMQVAEQIIREPKSGKTKIIMLTSAAQREEVARSYRLGVAACLIKPVKQSELLDTILKVLSSSGAHHLRSSRRPRRFRKAAGPLRILLAEDNPVNRTLATHLLEKRGHSLVVAENGREALAAFETQSFDVILMDVQMPEMGGLEATRAIREREKTTGAHVPVMAMTAHALKGDRERCLAAGMDAYISKPIQPEELFAAVENPTSPAAGAQHPTDEEARGEPGVTQASLLPRAACSTSETMAGRFAPLGFLFRLRNFANPDVAKSHRVIVILQPQRQPDRVRLVRRTLLMLSGTRQGHVILHQHAVLQHRHRGRTQQLAGGIESWPVEDNVVSLPLARRKAGVHLGRVLPVNGAGLPVRICLTVI